MLYVRKVIQYLLLICLNLRLALPKICVIIEHISDKRKQVVPAQPLATVTLTGYRPRGIGR